jgi:hypothetical protein
VGYRGTKEEISKRAYTYILHVNWNTVLLLPSHTSSTVEHSLAVAVKRISLAHIEQKYFYSSVYTPMDTMMQQFNHLLSAN